MKVARACAVLSLLLFHVWIPTATTQGDDLTQRIQRLRVYLMSNGYLSVTDANDPSSFTRAIVELQTTIGLEPTGVADDLLLSVLDVPRCGLADRTPQGYSVSPVKFDRHHLTYRIGRFPPFLSAADVRDAVRDSFQVWADVTPLTFQEVDDGPEADIQILFESRDHGDGAPFDGRGGILAHAYLPPQGDAHFDADETWTLGVLTGTNLFQVAAHEFGHSLGLFHSQDVNALMFPYYRGYQANFQLSEDDKEGIRSLYGREETVASEGDGGDGDSGSEGDHSHATTPEPPASPQLPPQEACQRNGTFDAVVNTKDGRTYGFIGAYVWRLDVYPRTYARIEDTWPGLPDSVHAAIRIGNVTYIFKDCFAWMYENRDYVGNVLVQNQWPGLPCNIQAGYVSPSDGHTYFFKGIFVYRYRGGTLSSRQRFWAQGWRHLPARNLRVTAANANVDSYGRETSSVYLFAGNVYYLLDDARKMFLYPRRYPRAVDQFILDSCPRS